MATKLNIRALNKIIILFAGIFFMISCSDKEDPIGKWDDIIKLSTKNVNLKVETDSIIITTEGDWWWIDGISFEDSTYIYYHREDINLESDFYSIKEDCFLVERRDKNTLFVKLNENKTGNVRIMKISLEAGDYFDYVYIKQAEH
jgi:hypothetical protein